MITDKIFRGLDYPWLIILAPVICEIIKKKWKKKFLNILLKANKYNNNNKITIQLTTIFKIYSLWSTIFQRLGGCLLSQEKLSARTTEHKLLLEDAWLIPSTFSLGLLRYGIDRNRNYV